MSRARHRDRDAPYSAADLAAGSEIKLTHLGVSVLRQRLADLFQRWSEKLRP